MKKYLSKYIVASALLLSAITANAALELELTQGVDKAIPVAIIPFTAAGLSAQSETLASVIHSDLQNSGHFHVTHGKPDAVVSPATLEPDFAFWRSHGIDNVVTGQLSQAPDGSITVNYKLFNTVGDQRLLVSKSLRLSVSDYRRLGHRISDVIYEELTGNRGIFSTKIAYVLVQRKAGQPTHYLLEVADADGRNPRTLVNSTAPLMSPAWSPDAGQLAYVSFENRRSSIYKVDVYSGQRALVSSFPGINGAPTWSPDGTQLALVLSKTGAAKIYRLDLASKRLDQLTTGMAIDTEPSFAPDGRSLLFTSDRGGSPQVYRLNLSNNRVNRLSFEGDYNACPEVLSNGSEFVLLHREAGMFNIAVQDIASGQLRLLTTNGQTESPTVAPNNQMVLFANKAGAGRVLNLVSIDGKVKLRLPSQEGEVQEPAWSPFIK